MLTPVDWPLRIHEDSPVEFHCYARALAAQCQEIAEILEDEIAALATGHLGLLSAAA
jgi:hypothetical protein